MPLQRPHIGQPDAQLAPAEQRRGAGILHRSVLQADIAQPERAAQAHPGRGGGRLSKTQRQIGAQVSTLPAGRSQRHRRRHIRPPGCEIGIDQVQTDDARAIGGKRQRLALQHDCGAVEPEGQPGQHLHRQIVGQVREKGQRQRQRAQLVHTLHRAVVEMQGSVPQLQVEKRESRRLGARRLRRRPGQPRDQVVDVVVAFGQPHQPQAQTVGLQGFEHRRAAPDRAQVGIDEQGPELQLRAAVGIARRRGQTQIVQGQAQGPGLELDLADAQRAPEPRAALGLDLPLQQRRHRQPGRTEQQQESQRKPQQASAPARRRGQR